MKILTNDKKSDLEIVLVFNKKLPKNLTKTQKDALALRDYKGEGVCFIGEQIFIGVDSYNYPFPNALRDAIANAIPTIKKLNIATASICIEDLQSAKEVCEGLFLGDYSFETYKSKKSQSKLKTIYLHSKTIESRALQAVITEVEHICISINAVREIINTPPAIATPEYVANMATKKAKELGITCMVYEQKFLEKEKMGAFLAVAKASSNAPYLVHLTYKPKNASGKKIPKIALVGKGLTYDSGGLSLKPGDYMTTMKADKSGACAVLGILEAVARLELNAEVHGILGLAENMIGGNAYKPDDILIARNKKSIEVRNTDAEGRLVLADCLSYASDLKPDFLLDIATLTGACVVALGDYSIGVMGYNAKLAESFNKIAFSAGELSATLPFNPYLRKLFNSDVADLCNIPSSRYGSAISAGMFLGEFVAQELQQKWLHLDIAGPAYVEKAWGVNPFGATGASVRSIVEFIKHKIKD
ncbi:leucyl aminopeptidase [Helicobacter turcicus]|uniref:Probable cytosol aminopeptidase n=1 Tax=Helicobacter turcicus TaxID=2867412 RepID=A0ABS7JLI0_9HELI|nr:leucyl aminopeptidase [Helicobacter turcicus]MBX7490259.1 leucyl aminopeptidase [Helicobacter turcicus]MBX7545162.1 leucyl aminopeptidase [Helicobacter turcicus]